MKITKRSPARAKLKKKTIEHKNTWCNST